MSPDPEKPLVLAKENAWRDARVAGEYDAIRFQTPLQRLKHRRDASLVVELLGARGPGAFPASVLDLPTGTGRLLPALLGAGSRVVAADISRPMLDAHPPELAARVLRVQATALRLPFRDGAFEATVCVRYLFHLAERAERVAVLSELRRVTRSVVVGQVRHRWNAKHIGRYLRSRAGLGRRYRPLGGEDVRAELEAAGLALMELRPISRLFSDKALFAARPRS